MITLFAKHNADKAKLLGAVAEPVRQAHKREQSIGATSMISTVRQGGGKLFKLTGDSVG